MSKNELVPIEEKQIEEYFKAGGMQPVLDQVQAKIKEFVPDMTTVKGRKEIASMASKVSRSKTLIDGVGKDYVAGIKAQAKVIDAERKRVRDTLDQWKEDVRRPLTDWENKDKERVANLQNRVTEIENHGKLVDENGLPKPLTTLKVSLKYLENLVIDDSFEEFKADAEAKKSMAVITLQAQVKQGEELEALQKKKEEEERARQAEEQKKREAEIAANAKREAEAKAAEADKRAREAEERARKAEENAKRVAREEAERERKRKEEEQRKREADVENKKKVNNAIKDALIECGVEDEHAKNITIALVKGRIPHVKVVY
jgi:hypothetical protein